ncbi:MAG: hypothetical protein N3A54_04520, partial [Patescibacteria group bacterium]|nr:hypothetical protein [Patescibacteria group bacterium]
MCIRDSIITLLYQFAPYHLIDILTRGAIGTIFVYSFFPLILWGLINQRVIITALSTALMVLSHNSMALIFFLISCVFVLFFIKNKMKSFFSLAIGLGLCSFYWIPALIEHKYTYGDLFMKDLFRVNFPPLQHFFIPNPLNHPSLRISEIALHWGFFHTIIFFFAILRWRKFDNQKKRITLFCFILIAVSIFFMHPISTPIWEKISFLRQFQFPWRFLSVIVFATSFLGIAVFKSQWIRKTLWFSGFIFLIVVPTLFYWRPTQGYRNDSNEEKFWNYPLNTTYFGETDVIWSAGPASSYPPSRIEIIEGQGTVSEFVKKNHQQTFIIEAKTDARIVSHTQYFPGWRVYVNNKKTPIQFQDQNWRGLITFYVPKGIHQIRIQFEETPVRLLANIITLLSMVFIVLKTIIGKMFHLV